MKLDEAFVKEHITRWINAWNYHNLKDIVSLYSENILFHSPKVIHIYPNQTSPQITCKDDLEKYFFAGLKKYPNLRFVPVGYFFRDQRVLLEYNATLDNNTHCSVMEKFEFDKDGLIQKSSVYYGITN